jgi:hypothetical protein
MVKKNKLTKWQNSKAKDLLPKYSTFDGKFVDSMMPKEVLAIHTYRLRIYKYILLKYKIVTY